MTLSEFLAARLDEDEAAAKAAVNRAFRHWRTEDWFDGCFLPDGRTERVDLWGDTGIQLTGQGALERSLADHIARHDPARVLREVKAKREILADCQHAFRSDAGADLSTRTLRRLGAVWSDHPDYDPVWAPGA